MYAAVVLSFFFFSSRRRHTRLQGDWSSDVCSSDLLFLALIALKSAGIVAASPATFVTLGDLHKPEVILASLGFLIIVVLDRLKVPGAIDRKSTRLNSSHLVISYAVFCLKKKHTVEIVVEIMVIVDIILIILDDSIETALSRGHSVMLTLHQTPEQAAGSHPDKLAASTAA